MTLNIILSVNRDEGQPSIHGTTLSNGCDSLPPAKLGAPACAVTPPPPSPSSASGQCTCLATSPAAAKNADVDASGGAHHLATHTTTTSQANTALQHAIELLLGAAE